MTRRKISTIISKRSTERMKVIRVKCRPSEKSDRVLVTRVGKHDWYCERPYYFWSALDQNFMRKGYLGEEELLYPETKEPLTLFDDRGLFWEREEMSSFGLVKHFVKNPTLYLWMMTKHTRDSERIVAEIKKRKSTLTNSRYFVENLHAFVGFYNTFFLAVSTVFVTFDELALQCRELLLKHLSKATVNEYFPNFLSGAMTQEALRKGYMKGRGGVEYVKTRGVLYGAHLPARAFYVPPKTFHEFPQDQEILHALQERNISDDDLKAFLSFRTIVPLGFQINEEAQYIESGVLSAHLGILMRAIAKKLGISLEDIQEMTVPKIIQSLKNYD